jgi:hypothetical protein
MHFSRVDIRHIGAAAALLMAGIYYLIGLGLLNIGGTTNGGGVDLFQFGVGAGTAFLAIGVLLAVTDKRWLWGLALVFQFLVFAMYIGVSGSRAPAFETWGITLRVIQIVLIACLTYLTFTASARRTTEVHR